MQEIRFHGRGGQGAVTAAELLAVAAADSGKYVKSFPFFGVERRGAPVQAFCRISDKPIRINQNVYEPDYIVVLDPSLMANVDVCNGLKKQGTAIVNCDVCAADLRLSAKETYTVDATAIALKHVGKPIVNTAMLGAFAKVTGLVKMEALEKAVKHRFPEKLAQSNIKAMKECFENTKK